MAYRTITNSGSPRLVLLISIATYYTIPPDAFPEQGIIYIRPYKMAEYGSCIEGYNSWFAGPAAAESLNGMASLKPEPLICYSGFDPLNCRNGDYSSREYRIN
jgi:hypothetical protein